MTILKVNNLKFCFRYTKIFRKTTWKLISKKLGFSSENYYGGIVYELGQFLCDKKNLSIGKFGVRLSLNIPKTKF